MEYKYDVALSFAGEEREYVEEVAQILKNNDVRVFYDKFEEIDLWGKDLSLHFDYVYRRQSKYFIPFISANYQQKIWTNYEVRTAIARAIENKEEYILPAKFDKTELDGIRSTLGYIDISKMPPEELADKIIRKLGSEANVPAPEKEKLRGKVYLSTYLEIDRDYGLIGVMIGVTVTNTINEYRYFGAPYFKLSQTLDGKSDTFQLMDTIEQLSFPKRMEYGEQYRMMYKLKDGFLKKMEALIGKEVTLTAIVSTTVGEKFKSNSMNIDMLFESNK